MFTREEFYRSEVSEDSLKVLRISFGDGLPNELMQRPRNILYTKGDTVPGSSSTPTEYGFDDPAFSARQYYERTDLTYNGESVWRGMVDPNFWIVRGIAPVSILDTFTKIVNPVVGGLTAYTNVWKVIERAGPEFFDLPPSGQDFYRSTLFGVEEADGSSVFGVIDGGPHPASGVYLRADSPNPILPEHFTNSAGVLRLETWDGEDETQGVTSRQDFCNIECDGCISYPVSSLVGPAEWADAAEAMCIDRGLTFVTAIMKPLLADGISGPVFYNGYTCCKNND